MAQEDDLDYFRQREAQERQAATLAKCAEAREAHSELADRYADQCWSLKEEFAVHVGRSGS